MHLTKRFLLLATVVAAASFVVVPSASADSATCTFDGVAGTIDPDIRPAPETGGSGTYTFGGGASCEYVDTTGAGANTEYNTSATIASSGEFNNIICSTGTAFSNWGLPPDDPDKVGSTQVNFANGNATDVTNLAYKILFTGGNGRLVIKDVNGSATSGGSGVVQILPSQGSSCTAEPGVSSFDVLGGFTAAIA
jgi:hypothetical protein